MGTDVIELDAVHNEKIEDVFTALGSTASGLPEREAILRQKQYGYNEIITAKKRSRFKLLWEQFNNPIVYVLLAAALISLFVAKLENFIVILVIIIVNGVIGFVQEFKAEKTLESLKKMSAPESTVLRDCGKSLGCTQSRIKAREIVPGDIIYLEAGDKVPADARLFEISNLQIDEAILTGESLPVRKTLDPTPKDSPLADRKNLVYSGTVVGRGRGKGVVYATGMNTQMGKIAQLINQTEEMVSPLEKRISNLGKRLGVLALVASLSTFLVGLVRGFLLAEMGIFSIATLVSSIPSGLPAIITITLAVGVSRMAKRHAIIRKLKAIDALGAVTTIVSDKTGTLTQNQMTARKIFADSTDFDITGIGYNPEGVFLVNNEPISSNTRPALEKILENAVLCNDSVLRRREIAEDQYDWEIVGDPTEGALLVAALKYNLNKEELVRKYPRVDEIPFEPKNRYMLTVHRDELKTIIHMKGAPEVVLSACSHIYQRGNKLSLTEMNFKSFMNQADLYASKGYRLLGFACGHSSSNDYRSLKQEFMNGNLKLTFLGFVGMIDPPRAEVKASIRTAQEAGITIVMATGDHKLTAISIGEEIGILKSGLRGMSGTEIEELDDPSLDHIVKTIRVFARVSPEHKYRIVESLKRNNEIVAMTGDGANDAPALKTADVGIAMGITGTDVTKDAASMILTDDNFASIVNAVEEGRVVYENIKKGIKFLLTTNMGEVITILLSMILILSHDLIFTPIMILWVNLVTDGTLTVALAYEPKESDVMKRPPRDIKEKFLDRLLLTNILVISVIMALSVLFIFNIYGNISSISPVTSDPLIRRETLAFTMLAVTQIFNAISSRSQRESIFKIGFRKNMVFVYGLIASLGLQVIAVHLYFFNGILSTTPLTLLDWLIILGIGSSVLFIDEIRKYFIRRKSTSIN